MAAATLSIASFFAAASSHISFQPFRHLRWPCSIIEVATPRISSRSWQSSRHEFHAARCMRPSGPKVRAAPAAFRLAAPTSAATARHALSARREPSCRRLFSAPRIRARASCASWHISVHALYARRAPRSKSDFAALRISARSWLGCRVRV
eukprot:scaffold14495_cov56-Phaeocystis_antarctica.AAC.6